MERSELLKLLNNKKLGADITINGKYCVFNIDTKKVVFEGYGEEVLYKLGIKFYSDFRI